MGCASIPLVSEIREAVKERYSGLAKQLAVKPAADASCGDEAGACCGGYTGEQLAEIGLTDAVSLGCGNPTLLAELRPGETVLDLGYGGGLDVLLYSRRVSSGGYAYGVVLTA